MKTPNNTTRQAPDTSAVEAARRMLADSIRTEPGAFAINGALWVELQADGERLARFVDSDAAECDTHQQRADVLRGIVREIMRDAELAIAADLNLQHAGDGGDEPTRRGANGDGTSAVPHHFWYNHGMRVKAQRED